ncbi:hypothetical protein ACFPM0_26940 [Pseudonocardia sulfidoxydans]|uniref:hypothetical protein n=1 Tax=Pseudonocardia sulfidoxydans TaxID=54011 RepID=UPI003612F4E7
MVPPPGRCAERVGRPGATRRPARGLGHHGSRRPRPAGRSVETNRERECGRARRSCWSSSW